MNVITVLIAAVASAWVVWAFALGYNAIASTMGPAWRHRLAGVGMWMPAVILPLACLWSVPIVDHGSTMGADWVTPWLPDALAAQRWIRVLAGGAAVAWGIGAAWRLLRLARQTVRICTASRSIRRDRHGSAVRPIVFSDLARSPMLVGYRKPFIVLPEGFRAAEPRLKALVCAHEEAHARRRDNWRLTAEQGLLAAFFWCAPLRRLHAHLLAAREELCDHDALRLASREDRRAYAQLLLSTWREAAPRAPVSRMTDGMAHAQRRLRSILEPTASNQNATSFRTAFGAFLVAAWAASFLAVAPTLSEQLAAISGMKGISLRLQSLGSHRHWTGAEEVAGDYHVKVIGKGPTDPHGLGAGNYRVTLIPTADHHWKVELTPVAH